MSLNGFLRFERDRVLLDFLVFLLDILEYEKLIKELSLENIQKAANQYFNVENYVQITLYPENPPGEN